MSMQNETYERLFEKLIERLNKNYNDYLDLLEDFSKIELIEMASKIHAVSDAHSYMTKWYDFDEYELKFYLQFQNPLEGVANEWRERNVELKDMCYTLEYLYENSDNSLLYYPTIDDIDSLTGTNLRRFMGVDLFDFLGKIAEMTIIYYPNDWNIDMGEFRRISQLGSAGDNRLIWHVCSTGTHLKNECETFIKDTGAHEYMTDYHQNDPDMFGYYVEVLGTNGNGSVVGNVFEVGNYAEFAKHIRKVAEPCESITLLYNDGSTKNLPKKEYDCERKKFNTEKGYPLPEIVYHPQDKKRLACLITTEHSRHMSYPLGSMGAHLRKIHETLKEVRTPPEKEPSKPKSLKEKMQTAQQKADVHNAQNKSTKTIEKEKV